MKKILLILLVNLIILPAYAQSLKAYPKIFIAENKANLEMSAPTALAPTLPDPELPDPNMPAPDLPQEPEPDEEFAPELPDPELPDPNVPAPDLPQKPEPDEEDYLDNAID